MAFALQGGVVYLAGYTSNPSANNNIIFTLPAGYRPSGKKRWAVPVTGEVAGVLEIDAGGDVYLSASHTAQDVLLDGVSFPVGL